MNIRLASYSLSSMFGRSGVTKSSMIGVKVCPTNGTSSVGTIVDIGKKIHAPYHFYTNYELKILWGYGPKKGQLETKSSGLVVHFDNYLAAIRKECNQLEAKAIEASTVGQ